MTLLERVLIVRDWRSEKIRTLQEVSSVSKGNGGGVLELESVTAIGQGQRWKGSGRLHPYTKAYEL